MNFSCWSHALAIAEANDGSDCLGISGRANQMNAQAGVGRLVMIKFGCSAVLRDRQIDAPISIVIANGRSTLLAVNNRAGATFLQPTGGLMSIVAPRILAFSASYSF